MFTFKKFNKAVLAGALAGVGVLAAASAFTAKAHAESSCRPMSERDLGNAALDADDSLRALRNEVEHGLDTNLATDLVIDFGTDQKIQESDPRYPVRETAEKFTKNTAEIQFFTAGQQHLLPKSERVEEFKNIPTLSKEIAIARREASRLEKALNLVTDDMGIGVNTSAAQARNMIADLRQKTDVIRRHYECVAEKAAEARAKVAQQSGAVGGMSFDPMAGAANAVMSVDLSYNPEEFCMLADATHDCNGQLRSAKPANPAPTPAPAAKPAAAPAAPAMTSATTGSSSELCGPGSDEAGMCLPLQSKTTQ